MTIGHFGVAAGAAYATYAHDWFAKLMGWPLGIVSLAAILLFALRGRAWALLFAAIFVPFVGVVGSWQMKADRYLIPLLPLAAIAGGIGLAKLAERLVPAARARAIVFAAMGVVALAPIVARLPAQRATLGTDTRTQARRWIERNLAPGSMIASEIYGPDLISPIGMQQYDADVRRELARRGGRTQAYAVQTVPMYVMGPERSAKYYDLERLRMADALVVSSAVRERYRGEPERYAAQLHFYAMLERSWPEVARFSPRGGAGPDLTIYRNPDARVPFASRTSVPPTDTTLATSGVTSGSEGFWYFNLGINHEMARQYPAARECYLLALRFGANEPDTYSNVALRLASLLRDEGRPGSALALLQMCADRAPGPVQAEVLRAGIATMKAGGEISAPVGR
jgi:hypothetical protein